MSFFKKKFSSSAVRDEAGLPRHVALIMDGNGRWAQKRHLNRNFGHKKGAERFEKLVNYALDLGIKHLTAFAFSAENFSRPIEEVNGIMDLMRAYLSDRRKQGGKRIRTQFIGSRENLAPDIVDLIKDIEQNSKENTEMTLNIAFNYGGKQEILAATRAFALDFKEGKIKLDNLTEESFSSYLYTAGQPDVDLLIRTSGEVRISNFLLWQCAYAEFVFTDVLFPDFDEKQFDKAILQYQKRERRLGDVTAQK